MHGDAFPASFGQSRMWFLDRFEATAGLYNLPTVWRLLGALDIAALEDAFNDVLARHEALRTVFVEEDGRLLQVIRPASRQALKIEACTESALAPRIRAEAGAAFDLTRDTLIRARVLRIAEDDHVLCLTLHHIAADGWSQEIVLKELCLGYEARKHGRPAELSDLAIQYADFAMWQRAWLQREELSRHMDYWKRYLKDAPRLIELPLDRPRPATRTQAVGVVDLKVGQSLANDIHALARSLNSTPFMVLAAAFSLVLSRHAGQDDVCVGYPVANRGRAQVEGVVGLFVNTLVLRTTIDLSATVSDLIAQTRESILGADAHQDLPFEKLVDELKPRRALDHTPLFQVMITFQAPSADSTRGGIHLVGISAHNLPVESTGAKFDLTLEIVAGKNGLSCALEYDAHLFDRRTVERMAGHWIQALEGMTRAPDSRLKDIQLMTARECEQVMNQWNVGSQVGQESWHPYAHEMFGQMAARYPAQPALLFEDERLSYGELDARANQLAHHLRANGVCSGAVVVILLERSASLIVSILAVLKAGGAYLPIDIEAPISRKISLLSDARACVAIADEIIGKVPGLRWILLGRDRTRIEAMPVTSPKVPLKPADLAYCLYTSGSTGQPKGVCIPHGALSAFLNTTQAQLGIPPGSTVAAIAPVTFDLSGFEIHGALSVGATVVLASREDALDPNRLADLIERHSVRSMLATPTTWRLLRQLPRKLSLGLALSCGEALDDDLAQYLASIADQAWNLYGPTETTIWSLGGPLLKSGPVTIGGPTAQTRVCVLDENLSPVPVGVAGELYIGGLSLARGYLGRTDLTAERFIPDPFGPQGSRMYKTGDRVRWRSDGKIQYLGRNDDQVKLRGFRIELGEVEHALLRDPLITQAGVFLQEGEDGSHLVACVVPKKGAGDGSVVAVRDRMRAALPYYMVPSVWVVLDRLPLNRSGKLDRAALSQTTGKVSQVCTSQPPKSHNELKMAQLWEAALGRPVVDVSDDFFQLGGNSMQAVRLGGLVSRAFEVEVKTVDVFRHPSLASLLLLVYDRRMATRTLLDDTLRKGKGLRCTSASTPNLSFESDLPLAGPTAVLLPGGGGLGMAMNPLGRELLRHQFKVAYLHYNGVEVGDAVEDDLEQMCKCYGDQVARLGAGPLVLVGYCLGGMLAARLTRYLADTHGIGVPLTVALDCSFDETGLDSDRTQRYRSGHYAALCRRYASRTDSFYAKAFHGLDNHECAEKAVAAMNFASLEDRVQWRDFLVRHWEVTAAHLRASSRYANQVRSLCQLPARPREPAACFGTLLSIEANQSMAEALDKKYWQAQGFREVCRRTVQGDHNSFLENRADEIASTIAALNAASVAPSAFERE
ncbi:amino acid adenylation domain-containing protein [Ideonella sp. 4Y16]|uniref:Amino acid adenylation domain-containing protein n=1 Tax=Ideonella alba TaxID=2824118 RepID=A0A940YEB1_9BURK|nr:non-ribosomal peptide synthetase [Ideonella alba]MBQ0933546.1 amino acid adenylation domain-containing protein [Ideonella alba]MBQ0946565.1 amino acid adenylation domain-containing protein [Ideonella alba]